MVALLHHQPASGRPAAESDAPLRLVCGPMAPGDARSSRRRSSADGARPHLALVPAIDGPARPSVGVVVAVALVVFGLFGAVRLAQGSVAAPADSGGGGVVVPSASPADGDRVVVARPGDTLWSIAATVVPDGDRRPVVAALIEANGGENVHIGQEIVVPGRLLD